MLYFNVDGGVDFGNYVFEFNLSLRHWTLEYKVDSDCIRYVIIGPLMVSVTNRKKLKELSDKLWKDMDNE